MPNPPEMPKDGEMSCPYCGLIISDDLPYSHCPEEMRVRGGWEYPHFTSINQEES
jgi:hypothetical protein